MKKVGNNINQAARTSSVGWSRLFGVPKVLDNVVRAFRRCGLQIGVVVVLNFQLLFSEEELSPAPSHLGAMYVHQGGFLLCIQLPHAVRLPSW
jgi:hypothetical protein